MIRKVVITTAFLIATLLPTTSYAGGYQRYVIYYSDNSFTTPVGKKFYPSIEPCESPYDQYHATGNSTVYIARQFRDICGTEGTGATCSVNGTNVSCPADFDFVNDWWSLGEDW